MSSSAPMSVPTAVVLSMGTVEVVRLIADLQAQKKKSLPSVRSQAGIFAAGLFLMLIGRINPALAKGLALIIALAVVLQVGIQLPSILTSAGGQQKSLFTVPGAPITGNISQAPQPAPAPQPNGAIGVDPYTGQTIYQA